MSILKVVCKGFCLLLIAITSACVSVSANTLAPIPTAQPPASQPAPEIKPTLTPKGADPLPTPSPTQTLIWLPDYLPQALRRSIDLPAGWNSAEQPNQAAVKYEIADQSATIVTRWIFALAAPFPTIEDEITLAQLQSLWLGSANNSLPVKTLLVDPSTRDIFESLWGTPGKAVQVCQASRLIDSAWKDNSRGTWAIIPFEELEPRWKVIAVDGQSPVRKDFDPTDYGLSADFGLTGTDQAAAGLQSSGAFPSTNRDDSQMTTVVLTGVTALVRGTASLMEGLGMTYPARDIGPWLREADILHVSNEVPFARNCPQPFDWMDLVFCSQTEYIQLLEDVGTDVVELTGDHFADWGPEAMLYTLDLYKERGWKYYGGGANLAEAQEPALFEHNGNKIAFLGCNGKDPGYAKAGPSEPGAGHCDFNVLTRKIEELRAQGYLPFITFQHLEYYQYVALPELQVDFRKMSSAGAMIVSGSQAHQPHAFEFRDGALLHYGLGNLFFDQTNQGDAPRTAFIDRHIIYGGRHISTELLTIYLVDYARSRPMTVDERRQMLDTVFKASGW